MSWFKRKNQSEIPPVAEPPASTNSYQSSSTSLPSYRSNASTYVPSRDGDLSDPRAWGKDPNAYRVDRGGQGYGQQGYGQQPGGYQSNNGYGCGYNDNNGYDRPPNKLRKDSGYGGGDSERSGSSGGYDRPSYGRKDSGYAGEEDNNAGGGYGGTTWNGPSASPFNRNQGREAFDPYSRGERNLEADRNALFAGAPAPQQGGPTSNRFTGGQIYSRDPRAAPNPGEETEEDLEALKGDIRGVKNQTADSLSNALRYAMKAQETGLATFNKLGQQSGTSLTVYESSSEHG